MNNKEQKFSQKVPLLKALYEYSKSPCLQFHIPGHTRGMGLLPEFRELLDNNVSLLDTTDEFDNLGTLHPATGAIKEAQDTAAKTFGAKKSFFLLNGSTIGNLALAISSIKPKDKVIIARNCHRSVVTGMLFSDAIPIWLIPKKLDYWDIWGEVTPQMVENALIENPDAKLVWITSPTYEGVISDIKGISEICKKYNVTFLVDEAHGSLWNFSDKLPTSALHLGADAVVHSIHKTGGSFSQSSIMHISKTSKLKPDEVEDNLRLLHSTSPSILLLTSLDAARANLSSDYGKKLITNAIENANFIRNELNSIKNIEVLDNTNDIKIDPTKIYTKIKGLTGAKVEAILELEFGIEIESTTDKGFLILCNIGNSKEEAKYFCDCIKKIAKASYTDIEYSEHNIHMPLLEPEIIMPPREAFYKEKENVMLKDVVGRICAEVIAECPPGIFILIPGEKITKEHLQYLGNYQYLSVIKEN